MRTRAPAVTAASLALAAVLAGCGSSGGTSGSGSMPGMDHSGGSMSSSPSQATGSAADIAFAQLMIPHHQQAVEMADLALANASSAEVKALATQIKAAQDPEIATMSGWLTMWGAPMQMDSAAGHDMGGMAMSGMMSDQDMADLEAAQGTEFDQMWLQMMIAHHQGAAQMANDVLASTDDEQVKMLAEAIVAGQTAEIEMMKSLFAS